LLLQIEKKVKKRTKKGKICVIDKGKTEKKRDEKVLIKSLGTKGEMRQIKELAGRKA
jgi:hypothetical protein